MRIILRTFADYREITGTKEMLIDLKEGQTMGGLFTLLTCKYPPLGRQMFQDSGGLKAFVIVLVNGRNIEFLHGMDTRLEEGDVVALFPPVAGG